MTTAPDVLAIAVRNLGLARLTRHLFLCATPTKPKCCDPAVGLATWEYLKQRLKVLGLDDPSSYDLPLVGRSKVDCLRVCTQGPILLVYPDGIWYHSVTPEVMECILQEHLLNNRVVEAFAFCRTRFQGGTGD
jgi:(2Fe-2S) ferredoxin